MLNFANLRLGLSLPAVRRVALKHFTFAWPDIETAVVSTSLRLAGRGPQGFEPPLAARLPKMTGA
jgi:hypothetical protein